MLKLAGGVLKLAGNVLLGDVLKFPSDVAQTPQRRAQTPQPRSQTPRGHVRIYACSLAHSSSLRHGQRHALATAAGAPLAGAAINNLIAENDGALYIGQLHLLDGPVIEVHHKVVFDAITWAVSHDGDI